MTSALPSVETFHLGPHIASRIWTGLWQLSSPEWGTAKVSKIREAMARHLAMGYNGFGAFLASTLRPFLTVSQIW